MNWTGGRLQQSKRPGGSLNAQQKAYFARARNRIQTNSSTLPLQLSIFGDVEVQRRGGSQARLPEKGERVGVWQQTPDQDWRPPATTKRRFQGQEDIEARRKDLLNRSDWLDLAPVQQFTMNFPTDREQERVGRRRRLNTEDFVRREKQQREKTTVHHGKYRRHSKSTAYITSIPAQDDRVSIRFGTSIHGSQWTQLAGAQQSTQLNTTPDGKNSDEMLFSSGTHSNKSSKSLLKSQISPAIGASHQEERDGDTVNTHQNFDALSRASGSQSVARYHDIEMLFERNDTETAVLVEASNCDESTREPDEEERCGKSTKVTRLTEDSGLQVGDKPPKEPTSATGSFDPFPGASITHILDQALRHSTTGHNEPKRFTKRPFSSGLTLSMRRTSRELSTKELPSPLLDQPLQAVPHNITSGEEGSKATRTEQNTALLSGPTFISPADRELKSSHKASLGKTNIKEPLITPLLPSLCDENAAWFKFVYGSSLESPRDPEQDPDPEPEGTSTRHVAISSSLEANASLTPEVPPSPSPRSILQPPASSPSSTIANDPSSSIKPREMVQQIQMIGSIPVDDPPSLRNTDLPASNVATVGTSTVKRRAVTFRRPRRFDGDVIEPPTLRLGGVMDGWNRNKKSRIENMAEGKPRARGKGNEDAVWDIESSEEEEKIEG